MPQSVAGLQGAPVTGSGVRRGATKVNAWTKCWRLRPSNSTGRTGMDLAEDWTRPPIRDATCHFWSKTVNPVPWCGSQLSMAHRHVWCLSFRAPPDVVHPCEGQPQIGQN